MKSVLVTRKWGRIYTTLLRFPSPQAKEMKYQGSSVTPSMILLTTGSKTNNNRVRAPDSYCLPRTPTDTGICSQRTNATVLPLSLRKIHVHLPKNPQKFTSVKYLLYCFVVIKLQTIANMKFCIHISEVNYVVSTR